MPNEISAVALLQSDFERIDQEVDRIAMAYCEARLVELAQRRDKLENQDKKARAEYFESEWDKLRKKLLHEDSALGHLLYWLDIRADYYRRHKAPAEDAARVAVLLEHFAKEADQLRGLAQRARERQHAEAKAGAHGEDVLLYANAEELHALTHSETQP